jgi:hypothetical protein
VSVNEQVNPYWRPSPTCWVCAEPSSGESTAYLCIRCKEVLHGERLTATQKDVRIRHMRDQWERHGDFLCSYTGVKLDLEDPSSVRFREWEHAKPGDETSVVLAAALVNRMKCYLDVDAFRRMVIALADHFTTNTPFDVDAWPNVSAPRSPQAT